MFYVCAICTISDKANPLVQLTGELRQIWKRILTPHLRITKLASCRLLVCLECKQLLDTILKFRRTMTIGARNLLSLHKALEDKHVVKKQTHCYLMPPLLQVAREEVVHSTESWDDIVVPTKRPRILNRKEDDAVLLPNGGLRGWKAVHPPAASLLRGPSATERNNATTQIETAMPMPKDAKEKINKAEIANVNNKIKLNRQLFDAVKATLQSSLTEEFDIKYEPEPEMGCESEPESRREPDFGHDSDLGAGPHSDSTLSCQSDYEDPEHYPNIIFARAFDAISAKDSRRKGKGLEVEGKAEDVQIHSHIVTNPPSEWPCTWELCQLQAIGEDENLESRTEGPRNRQATRSRRKGIGRFQCKVCEKIFRSQASRWLHSKRDHVKCDLCSAELGDETELKFHKIKHQIKMTAGMDECAPHACAQCGARFHYPHSLRQHLDSSAHAAVTLWSFQCDTCKRKFPDKKRIVRHIQREHLAKERVKCPMCRSTFKNAHSLRQHARAHILAQTQDNADKQTNAQRNTSTATDKNSEIKKYSNRQDNTHTYVNEQESKQQLNGQTHNINNTHTDIQSNGQINTDANKINAARRRVQKRRRKCPYARKRASKRAPVVQEPDVAKASLFDMLSSFIL